MKTHTVQTPEELEKKIYDIVVVMVGNATIGDIKQSIKALLYQFSEEIISHEQDQHFYEEYLDAFRAEQRERRDTLLGVKK